MGRFSTRRSARVVKALGLEKSSTLGAAEFQSALSKTAEDTAAEAARLKAEGGQLQAALERKEAEAKGAYEEGMSRGYDLGYRAGKGLPAKAPAELYRRQSFVETMQACLGAEKK